MRILHQEILVNIYHGLPLPNFLVYDRPWYRDAAMMAMVLQATGNLHLIRDWVMNLRDPFDCNNGTTEPDNLGQVLYLISLFADSAHPVVSSVLSEAPRFHRDEHISGMTDGSEHPVYQTKWLKYGLGSLGLDDPYVVPMVPDTYGTLFWWDYTDRHVPSRRTGEQGSIRYPYLAWAEHHFIGDPPPLGLLGEGYPATWESHASAALYGRLESLDAPLAEYPICMPHTWHAAEAFLYLWQRSTMDP
ncbi:MAG: hypothetical protein E4H09_01135 [Spirochaetales bacterium]|nr:MAG: hypothetical protein E4H09_01135 [Spirochaetales bacterium]